MTAFTDWRVDFSTGIPVYKQIVNYLFLEIGRGSLREGDRLPTIKELAEQLNVNPNTVAKAYRELDIKGIIAGRRGDGSYVSAQPEHPVSKTTQQKRVKLDELFGRVIAEAKAYGITEADILEHIAERIHEDE
ncbi:MAG TPA: GntR family transcriptional regulator [bacterium]|nr:GntR family transcriptional regulator [bacterium]